MRSGGSASRTGRRRRSSSGCSGTSSRSTPRAATRRTRSSPAAGDVFITYENEARLAKLQYVIPRQTLLIEAPIAVIKTSESRDVANTFIRFTKTAQAQRIFAQFGFRPTVPSVYKEFEKQYPRRPGIFKIDDKYIGGWSAVDKKWFDPDKGIWVGIARRTGVGT